MARTSTTRRAFMGQRAVLRPPGASESRVLANCTGCGDCIAACPEAILVAGGGNTPHIDFQRGACTFCGKCAEACAEDVFSLIDTPWRMTAVVAGNCILSAGISCDLCRDSCQENALRIDLSVRPVGAVRISDACTGCGACVSACIASAIEITALAEDRVDA